MISVSLCVIATIARRAPRQSLNALNLSFNAPYETALCRERILRKALLPLGVLLMLIIPTERWLPGQISSQDAKPSPLAKFIVRSSESSAKIKCTRSSLMPEIVHRNLMCA